MTHSETTGGRSGRRRMQLVTLAVAACALAWAVVAVLCAPDGLDTSDESFYLLSYRWWNVNFDNFTGVQYFYGPVFELLDYNIAALRVVRLLVLLVAHAFFGWQFMRWLRLQRPAAPSTRWWEAAGTTAVVACSGIGYSWLPLSPGYNDLALTGAVIAAGAALRIARAVCVGVRAPWWASAGLGAVAVVMLLTKWSSMLVLVCVGVVLLVVVSAQGLARVLAVLGLIALGAGAMLCFIQLALVPLPTLLPPMLEVNSLVAESTNSPTGLADFYLTTTRLLMEDILAQQWPLLVAALLMVASRRLPRTTLAVAIVALAVGVVQAVRHDGLIAGPMNLPGFSVTMYTPLLVVLVVAVIAVVQARTGRAGAAGVGAGRRGAQIRRWAVYALVVALPIVQAAGTGNQLHYLAVIGLGSWMAAVVAVLTALPRDERAPRVLVGGVAAALVVSTTVLAVDGLWNRPYRTTGHAESTAVAAGVPALDSVRLAPRTAADFARLRERLAPFTRKPGRAMMGFDGLAGIILLLEGRPVGEAWYSAKAPDRSAAGIRRACEDGDPWWGERKPVVMFNRPVRPLERQTLRSCGLSLRTDYRHFRVRIQEVPITVFVPRRTPEEQR